MWLPTGKLSLLMMNAINMDGIDESVAADEELSQSSIEADSDQCPRGRFVVAENHLT